MGLFPKVHTNNQTLPSDTKCKDGESWWASFEFYPEAVGRNKSAFQGLMYVGQDFWSQQSCVVKFRNYGSNNVQEFLAIIKDCEESNNLVGKFSSEHGGQKIEMLVPLLVKMETTSVFNGLFRLIKGYERIIHDDDVALLEKRIKGKYTTYIDKFGNVDPNCPPILQAFCHFTYHESKGKSVVTNIQGGWENGRLVLSSPVIHSTSVTGGPDDNGEVGIQSFFAQHRCNDICSKFLHPNPCIPTAPSWSTIDTKEEPDSKHNTVPLISYQDAPPPYICYDTDTQKLLPGHFSDIAGVHTI